MREIKFRVWHKGVKKFITEYTYKYRKRQNWQLDGGDLAIDCDGVLRYNDYGNGMYCVADDDMFSVKLDDYIIEQYTGLTDKNGQEIYEGDIIDNHEEYHNIKIVNYDPYRCYFCLIDIDEWPKILYNGEMFNIAGEGSNFSSRIEVIGNIHERNSV